MNVNNFKFSIKETWKLTWKNTLTKFIAFIQRENTGNIENEYFFEDVICTANVPWLVDFINNERIIVIHTLVSIFSIQ